MSTSENALTKQIKINPSWKKIFDLFLHIGLSYWLQWLNPLECEEKKMKDLHLILFENDEQRLRILNDTLFFVGRWCEIGKREPSIHGWAVLDIFIFSTTRLVSINTVFLIYFTSFSLVLGNAHHCRYFSCTFCSIYSSTPSKEHSSRFKSIRKFIEHLINIFNSNWFIYLVMKKNAIGWKEEPLQVCSGIWINFDR